jgi:hypothetical protein
MKLTKQEILKLAVSVMYLGLFIDLIGAAVLFVAGQIVRKYELVTPVEPEGLTVLGYSLIGVGIIEILMIVILKKRWISSKSPQLNAIKKRDAFYRHLRLLFIILFLIALTPALYGFLYFILGGTEENFMILLAITLIGYMLTRMRPNVLEEAVGDIELEDPG